MTPKTINMYQNPKTGVYEAQLKPKGRIIIIGPAEKEEEIRKTISKQTKEANLGRIAIVHLVTESRTEISQSEPLSEILDNILTEMKSMYKYYQDVPQILMPTRYPSEFDYRSKKYSSRKESISREQRHIACRASNSWRRESHLRR